MEKIKTASDFFEIVKFLKSKRNQHFEDLTTISDENIEFIQKEEIKELNPSMLSSDLILELIYSTIMKLNPDYVIDKPYVKTLTEISNFLSMSNTKKGFLVMGKVGCGKTTIMKAIRLFMASMLEGRMATTYMQSYLISTSFTAGGVKIFSEGVCQLDGSSPVSLMRDNLFIDDIGSEDICNHYGTTTNSVGEILSRRYDLAKRTFATTNLDPENLKKFYGDRVYSRMKEMMIFVVMEGEDRRK